MYAQIGVPDSPSWPKMVDWLLMLAVALTSFFGQLVVGRAYQIEVASKVAAVSYVQVSSRQLAAHSMPAIVGQSTMCWQPWA